jgi:hypothetical protein
MNLKFYCKKWILFGDFIWGFYLGILFGDFIWGFVTIDGQSLFD